jgi:hypothetical protein
MPVKGRENFLRLRSRQDAQSHMARCSSSRCIHVLSVPILAASLRITLQRLMTANGHLFDRSSMF